MRDAHDRYANIESAYLLQRMETPDGIAVLAIGRLCLEREFRPTIPSPSGCDAC